MGKYPNKKSGRLGFDFFLNKLALIAFTVLGGYFVYTAISTQMLDALRIGLLCVVVAATVIVVWWLSLTRSKPVRLAIGSVLAMIFCLVFAVGIRYINIGMDTLNNITAEEDETTLMTVYVRSDDDRNMEDLLDETFGTLSVTESNTKAAIQQLDQEIGRASCRERV